VADDRSPAEALLAWYADTFPAPPPPVVSPALPAPRRALPLGDHEVVERARAARNGDRFARLWGGDCSLYGGDHSRADLALCGLLYFWTNGDRSRIDRLFRQSGLMRSKWDARRGDRSYGARTLDHVCVLGAAR
jgi:hypothetical protein